MTAFSVNLLYNCDSVKIKLHLASLSLGPCGEIQSSCCPSLCFKDPILHRVASHSRGLKHGSVLTSSHSRELKHGSVLTSSLFLAAGLAAAQRRPCVCPSCDAQSHDATKPKQSKETQQPCLISSQYVRNGRLYLFGSMFVESLGMNMRILNVKKT